MPHVLLAMFDSHARARAVRDALVQGGIAADHVEVRPSDTDAREIDQPLPGDRGISGFIRRMFSGALMDDAEIRKYMEHAERGACALVLHTGDRAELERARAVLERHAPLDLHQSEAGDAGAEAPDAAGTADTARSLEAEARADVPEGSALPQAPTGWDDAGGRAALGGERARDPARPQAALGDGMGLDTDTWRARGAGRSERARPTRGAAGRARARGQWSSHDDRSARRRRRAAAGQRCGGHAAVAQAGTLSAGRYAGTRRRCVISEGAPRRLGGPQ